MIHLDTLSTLVAATLVLLLGRKLVHSCVPACDQAEEPALRQQGSTTYRDES